MLSVFGMVVLYTYLVGIALALCAIGIVRLFYDAGKYRYLHCFLSWVVIVYIINDSLGE